MIGNLTVGFNFTSICNTYNFIISRRITCSKRSVCGYISCGGNNDYGHPHSEPMSRLRDADVDIYRNDKLGTVIAYCDGETIWFSWEFTDAKPEYNK